MKRVAAVLTALTIAATLGVTGPAGPSTAVAQESAGTTMVFPADHSTVKPGFDTFTIQMNEPAGTYLLHVYGCLGNDEATVFDEYQTFAIGDDNPLVAVDLGQIKCAHEAVDGVDRNYAKYYVTVQPGDDISTTPPVVSSVFTVDGRVPAPTIARFRVSPAVIYSTVQDGYRDFVRIAWRVKRIDRATVSIMHGHKRLAKRSSDTGIWKWHGHKARPGRYAVKMTATNADGRSISRTRHFVIRRTSR